MEEKKITQILCKESYKDHRAKITEGKLYDISGYDNSSSDIIRVIDDYGYDRGFDIETHFEISKIELSMLAFYDVQKLFKQSSKENFKSK